MQVTPSPTSLLPTSLGEAAYKSFQWSKNYFGLAHKFAATRVAMAAVDALKAVGQVTGAPVAAVAAAQKPRPAIQVSQATLDHVRLRYEGLLDADWQDAEQGYYSHALLFDNPWQDFLQTYPFVWLDLPAISQRVNAKNFQEFANDIDTEGYPAYYLQNFHHQTDGYLSDRSAALYDHQVELLFGGSADAMRRRIIRPMVDHLGTRPGKMTHILDVACGTGRALKMLRSAFPQAKLYGTDLSPAYLRKANQLLGDRPGELPQLLQANAEALPYADGVMDIATSVFLFHELPATARQQVLAEMVRVTKPGGLIVLCDSIQIEDSPQLQESMEAFAATFHEPYYRDYIRDDLGKRLTGLGCEVLSVEAHFMSRYTVARKA